MRDRVDQEDKRPSKDPKKKIAQIPWTQGDKQEPGDEIPYARALQLEVLADQLRYFDERMDFFARSEDNGRHRSREGQQRPLV